MPMQWCGGWENGVRRGPCSRSRVAFDVLALVLEAGREHLEAAIVELGGPAGFREEFGLGDNILGHWNVPSSAGK